MTPYWPQPHQAIVPTLPWYKRQWVRITLTIAAIVVIGAGAMVMLGILGFSFGPGLLIVSIFFALLPVPVLMSGVYWLSRYNPAPWWHLALTFGWGAFVATLIALLLNELGGALITDTSSSDEINNRVAVFIAPPVEETAKAIPLLLMMLFTVLGYRLITGITTGIVYAASTAIGFAFTENILYFGYAYNEGAEDDQGGLALIFVFVFRAVLSPFAHPLFTVFIGVGIGVAVRTRHIWLRFLTPLVGLLAAMLLHGTWNALASTGDLRVMGVGYVGLMLPLLASVIAFSIWMRMREGRSTQRALPQYAAAGWFTLQDVANLATMRERVAARRWIRPLAGSQGVKAVAKMQTAATQLAMLREDADKGAVHRDFSRYESELLHIIRTVTLWMQSTAAWQYERTRAYWQQIAAYQSDTRPSAVHSYQSPPQWSP